MSEGAKGLRSRQNHIAGYEKDAPGDEDVTYGARAIVP